MALSQRKRLNIERGYVVISGDASLNYGKVLAWAKTKKGAYKLSRKWLFAYVRHETDDQVKDRLAQKATKE